MVKESIKLEKAIFAGGCFWCVAEAFDKVTGVKEVISGYTGGKGKNPNYEDYASKGFIEAIQITYDPKIISYPQLLKLFWKQIDPTDSGGQFSDRGPQYRSAIFYFSEQQRQEALKSKNDIEKFGISKKSLSTEISKASKFYPAEQYHQDYHKKNPVRYKFYRLSCGRDQRLREIWG